MIDGNARDLMVHFVSPKKDLRGIGIVKDIGNGFDKIEGISDFVGSYYKIMPNGKFLKEGRYKMMWIDLDNDASDPTTLNMSNTGINEIREWGNELTSTWKWMV